MEWTPEGARERLRTSYRDDPDGPETGAFDDLEKALARIATLEAQAQAWEQERAGLVEKVTRYRKALEVAQSEMFEAGLASVRSDAAAHDTRAYVAITDALWGVGAAATVRPTAQEGA